MAAFSSRTFGAANTGSVLAWFLRAAHITLNYKQFMIVHVMIRKSAHFIAYGLLSAVFFRAWRGGSQLARWRWTWAVLSLLVCLLTASSDELHQHFTPGRSGALADVFLDMIGATFAQAMILFATAEKRRSN